MFGMPTPYISDSSELNSKLQKDIDADTHLNSEERLKLTRFCEEKMAKLNIFRLHSLQFRDLFVKDF